MALDNISFSCNEKEMTALVGESGSGKSTIGQLILRFWDVGAARSKLEESNVHFRP